MAVDRTAHAALVDDDGSNTVGTPILKATWASVVLDPVDAEIVRLDAADAAETAAVRTVAKGGTGVATLAAHGLLIGNGTSALAVSGAGTAGQVLTSNGAAADPTFQAAAGGGISVLDRDVTTVEVVNTVTETTLYSFSVPGNTLGTNKMLRVTLIGDYLNNSGSNAVLTVRGKYGGTTFSTPDFSMATEATRRTVRFTAEVMGFNATNAQVAVGLLEYMRGVTGGSSSGAAGAGYSGHTGMAVDSTAAQTLLVSVEHGTAASTISFRAHSVILELV